MAVKRATVDENGSGFWARFAVLTVVVLWVSLIGGNWLGKYLMRTNPKFSIAADEDYRNMNDQRSRLRGRPPVVTSKPTTPAESDGSTNSGEATPATPPATSPATAKPAASSARPSATPARSGAKPAPLAVAPAAAPTPTPAAAATRPTPTAATAAARPTPSPAAKTKPVPHPVAAHPTPVDTRPQPQSSAAAPATRTAAPVAAAPDRKPVAAAADRKPAATVERRPATAERRAPQPPVPTPEHTTGGGNDGPVPTPAAPGNE